MGPFAYFFCEFIILSFTYHITMGMLRRRCAESDCRNKLKRPDLSTMLHGLALISAQEEFSSSQLSLYRKRCGFIPVIM